MKIAGMSVFAARSEDSVRENKINNDYNVDAFQRDSDIILLSKEYRRSSGKTQVFVAGFDDNIRTRLTHTLEVAQIADIIVTARKTREKSALLFSYIKRKSSAEMSHGFRITAAVPLISATAEA